MRGRFRQWGEQHLTTVSESEEEEEERPRTFIQPRPSQDFMQRYRNIKFKLPATEEVDEPVHQVKQQLGTVRRVEYAWIRLGCADEWQLLRLPQNEEEAQHWRAMKRLELEGTVLPAITYEPPSPNPTPTASAAVTPFPSTAASRASTAQHAAAGSVMQGRPLSAGRTTVSTQPSFVHTVCSYSPQRR
jgi:hypothetical protein